MVDWATISSLATAGGTLVLAVATFYSVRSANRSARNSERALQLGLRPVLFASRPQDPDQVIRWGDDHWAHLAGGQAVLEERGGTIYLAMSLRNVGSGLAVLQGWRAERAAAAYNPAVAIAQGRAGMTQPEIDQFRPQGRDLYVPPGDISFWQAALRDPEDRDREGIAGAIQRRQLLLLDLLYADHEGGQRTISRFSVTVRPDEGEEAGARSQPDGPPDSAERPAERLDAPLDSAERPEWLCSVVRHWYLDRQGPR